jgi:hypothetical protein
VLRSLLSHQVGAQGFWTTFLTDPELVASTQAPFDPSLLNAMARFPELNMGVLSSCLAMSATEETVYDQVMKLSSFPFAGPPPAFLTPLSMKFCAEMASPFSRFEKRQ